ncbi:hypothetical protein [Knoellia sp. LjRoot47]|uniref:hypothetical protein n=1 Tax=Knoellia sp. LjRoot47 TaxID=3342330 RepID=UPI003ECCFB69
MSRTLRTIGVVALTATTFTAVAASAHAAPIATTPFSQTVIGEWRVEGTLAGAPGNVHTGFVNLSDGTGRLTAMSAYDWQCPDETTSPDEGACTQVRTTSATDFESSPDLVIDRGLRAGAGSASVIGEVSDGQGPAVPTTVDVAVDLHAAGRLTREVYEQSDETGGTYTVVVRQRAAIGSVTYNGVRVTGVTGHVLTQTRR